MRVQTGEQERRGAAQERKGELSETACYFSSILPHSFCMEAPLPVVIRRCLSTSLVVHIPYFYSCTESMLRQRTTTPPLNIGEAVTLA
jgi:hypothetical protein